MTNLLKGEFSTTGIPAVIPQARISSRFNETRIGILAGMVLFFFP
jgi:hypothetical protein